MINIVRYVIYGSTSQERKGTSEYANHGARWTEADKRRLEIGFTAGEELQVICDRLGRPVSGVLCKLHEMKYLVCNVTTSEYKRREDYDLIRNFSYETSTETPKETTMNDSTPLTVSNKTYVFGVDSSLMSDNDFISALLKVEKKIDALNAVKTPSKKIASMIEALEADRLAIVTLFDGKV